MTPDKDVIGESTAKFWSFNCIQSVFISSPGALYSAFSSCAAVLYACQVLAVLEVINAAVGLVEMPVFPAMIQARLRSSAHTRNLTAKESS